jgi:diguanylate cyclase (GGDEF)-like protein
MQPVADRPHGRSRRTAGSSMKIGAPLSLRALLTIPYVSLVVALAVAIGALSYQAGRQAVDTVAEHLLLETVHRIGQAVERHVVGSGAVLEAAFPNGMVAPRSVEEEFDALRTRFWIATSLHLDPNNYVYYGNREGQFFGLWRFDEQEAQLRLRLQSGVPRTLYRFTGIHGALREPQLEERIFEPRTRPWYLAGRDASTHTWTSIYIDFRTQSLVATRARRVLHPDGSIEGVVATDVALKGLNDFVRNLDLTPNGFAFIIEPDGQLIAASNAPNITQDDAGAAARLAARDSGNVLLAATYAELSPLLVDASGDDQPRTRQFTAPDGQLMQAAFSRVTDSAGLDWFIVVAVPHSDFMHGVTDNVKRTVMLGAAAAALVVMLGLVILSWVARDLRRLSQAARAIGEGDLNVPLRIRRRDEIGDLARSFVVMQHKLRTDRLTGLVNRETLLRRLDDRVAFQRRAGDTQPFAVLFIDLNGFKAINDRHGHDVGDRVLVALGRRLRQGMREGDLVSRYAGDEFVILVEQVAHHEVAEQVRAHVEALLREPLADDVGLGPNTTLDVGGAVGLAVYPDDGRDSDSLLQRADRDMYERKRQARP